MENLKELELSELILISGGVNVAYELGYAFGRFLKKFSILKTMAEFI
jgi:hypothetical protein